MLKNKRLTAVYKVELIINHVIDWHQMVETNCSVCFDVPIFSFSNMCSKLFHFSPVEMTVINMGVKQSCQQVITFDL